MPKKLIIDPTPMTLEEFRNLGPDCGLPADAMGKDFQTDVEALERDYGPQVPPFLCRRGRPSKGTVPTPVQPRVVKMPPAFWATMSLLAGASGLTLHAAMREALVQWTLDHQHPRTG